MGNEWEAVMENFKMKRVRQYNKALASSPPTCKYRALKAHIRSTTYDKTSFALLFVVSPQLCKQAGDLEPLWENNGLEATHIGMHHSAPPYWPL